jgi:DNA repair protein RadA/Sms
MAKSQQLYQCTSCEHTSSKWLGQCPGCKAWNSFPETPLTFAPSMKGHRAAVPELVPLTQRDANASSQRMVSGTKEWDRVLGGGILPGAFIMLTGDPGIGKSTLLLQIAHQLAANYTTLYFSSEESREQVRTRAQRLGCLGEALLFSDQAHIESIITAAEHHKPQIIIIDSLQNCFSDNRDVAPGSISHLRDIAFKLLRLAKEQSIAVLLSGHITKDGTLAGPKLLEHMVDAVFYLQGEDRWQKRMLRAVKNRFGTIDEIGFFEMHEQGLRELSDVNEQVLADAAQAPGSVLISSLEGTRPLLIELQALTIASHFSMPQRLVTGIDQKQVVIVAAILEKYLKIKFSAQDIFFKVGGGMKLKGSNADLGIALALLSSYLQQALPSRWLALGEISLAGNIKPINCIAPHINEARKFGIEKICIAASQRTDCPPSQLKTFRSVYDLLGLFKD